MAGVSSFVVRKVLVSLSEAEARSLKYFLAYAFLEDEDLVDEEFSLDMHEGIYQALKEELEGLE